MNITIEQLPLEELQAFLREQANDAFPDLKDEQRLKMLSEKWYSQAEFCTCRDDNKQLVGMIAFYANQSELGAAFIPHVYISKEYRGTGFFRKMLQEVEEYVKLKGFSSIRLEVKNDNLRAQKAYSNNGFYVSSKASGNSLFMKYEITK